MQQPAAGLETSNLNGCINTGALYILNMQILKHSGLCFDSQHLQLSQSQQSWWNSPNVLLLLHPLSNSLFLFILLHLSPFSVPLSEFPCPSALSSCHSSMWCQLGVPATKKTGSQPLKARVSRQGSNTRVWPPSLVCQLCWATGRLPYETGCWIRWTTGLIQHSPHVLLIVSCLSLFQSSKNWAFIEIFLWYVKQRNNLSGENYENLSHADKLALTKYHCNLSQSSRLDPTYWKERWSKEEEIEEESLGWLSKASQDQRAQPERTESIAPCHWSIQQMCKLCTLA